ncbi:S8 family peptidase [Polaribacter tangerinus]|uniref:S8 family peptidase n=1 Tax=Polaribacter tangerinus TaxID=1920034 RepID=UPI0021D038B1|nr:S8 family peptidase [Polaribacter tangerinus]
MASFSSKGPTVDYRVKPDITAPGNRIVSAISSFDESYTYDTSTPFNSQALYSDIEDGLTDGNQNWHFAASQGTSMSAPVVTGIIALILEANPNLNLNEIKEILNETAARDTNTENTSPTLNNTWGVGKINAYDAIKSIEQTLSTEQTNQSLPVNLYPNPTKDYLYFDNTITKFESINVINVLGVKLIEKELDVNNTNIIDVSKLQNGIYLIEFLKKGMKQSAKIIKK